MSWSHPGQGRRSYTSFPSQRELSPFRDSARTKYWALGGGACNQHNLPEGFKNGFAAAEEGEPIRQKRRATSHSPSLTSESPSPSPRVSIEEVCMGESGGAGSGALAGDVSVTAGGCGSRGRRGDRAPEETVVGAIEAESEGGPAR